MRSVRTWWRGDEQSLAPADRLRWAGAVALGGVALVALGLVGFRYAAVPLLDGEERVDTFDRAEFAGGPLGWAGDTEGWRIEQGAALTASVDGAVALIEPAEGQGRMTVRTTTPGQTEIYLRYQDIDNHWFVGRAEEPADVECGLGYLACGDHDTDGPYWAIGRVIDGEREVLSTSDGPFVEGDPGTEITVYFTEDVVDLYVEGELLLSIVEPSLRDESTLGVAAGPEGGSVRLTEVAVWTP